MPAVDQHLEPDPATRALYDDLFGVYRSLYPATRAFQPALARAARPT
jgi:xylulokinase